VRRTERLFQIIQILRGATSPVTAQMLADEMETSLRTMYRDIAELLAQHVPIRGEAGVGYILEDGYDMPPLMLTPNEIEAAVLGAQWVAARGDPALARGARDLISKISEVIPADLRPFVAETAVVAPNLGDLEQDPLDMEMVRTWIRTRGKLAISYATGVGKYSERVIWPITVGYFETSRLIVAWCELRKGFRHFRTDRILSARFLDETFPTTRQSLRAAWWKSEQAKTQDRDNQQGVNS